MKKVKLVYLILLALSLMVFTSCDENQPEETNPTYPIDINRDRDRRDRDRPANETPITDWDNVELGNIGWMSLTEADGSYSYNMDFRELGLNDTHASTHAFRVVYFFDDPNSTTSPADVTYVSEENIEQWNVKKSLKSYEGTDTAPWYEHNIGNEADGFFLGNPQRVSAMLCYNFSANEAYNFYFKGISEGFGKTKMQLVGMEYYKDNVKISISGDTNLLTPYVPI